MFQYIETTHCTISVELSFTLWNARGSDCDRLNRVRTVSNWRKLPHVNCRWGKSGTTMTNCTIYSIVVDKERAAGDDQDISPLHEMSALVWFVALKNSTRNRRIALFFLPSSEGYREKRLASDTRPGSWIMHDHRSRPPPIAITAAVATTHFPFPYYLYQVLSHP